MPNPNQIPVDTTGYYNKSVDLMNKYKNLNFVQRATNPELQKITMPDALHPGKGNYMSHRMSYAGDSNEGYVAYPEVVQVNGKLKYMPGKQAMQYAYKNKQAIPLGTDQNFADYFTTVGYKYKMKPDVYNNAMKDYINNTNIMKLIPKNKKGGSSKNWIQGAVNPKHKGYCTPMSKSTCTPRRKALARRFKAMAKHQQGGLLLPNIQAQLDELKNKQQIAMTPLATHQVSVPSVSQSAPVKDRITPQQTNLSFGDAFKQAREKGLDKFSWNGKLYTTEMKTAPTNKPAVKDRISATKQVTPPVAATSKKTEYVKPLAPVNKQESKVTKPEIKKEVPSKPVTKSTETKVETPTRTVKQRIPETKKPYITFKPGESQTFEPQKSNIEPPKKYVSNIEDARKVLKGKNVMDTPLNPKHRGYLHTALEEIIGKYKKGGQLSKEYIKKAHEKPGGSNVGKKTFASGAKRTGPYVGPSGGSPKGSYPIPDKKHARSALSLAHHAPNPEGIKRAVYRKYPELKK